MTQTQISISSSTEPVAINEDDRVHFSIAQMQSTRFAEVKAAFPACQNILSLLQHLHSDCADPEAATICTLEWIAGALRAAPIQTHIAFCDGQGTGKTLFTQMILKPIFGNKTRLDINGAYLPYLQFIDELQGDFYKQMEEKILATPNTKFYDGKASALIFQTNLHIPPCPSNRIVRIARCKTPLPYDLFSEVMSEIEGKGLMTFADLLHQIHPDTLPLPNLNAIY